MLGSRLLQQAPADAPGSEGAVAPMSSRAPQPTPLQPPPPPSLPKPAPPQEAPAPILPANVTVARTARQLQRAMLRGAIDIEIREHLNLRNLTRPPNPAMPGGETFQNRKHLALMYASSPLRSLRGNCSDPDPAAALGLRASLTPALLPLRPRQCLLLLPDTWLMVNSGTLWIDNIYLRASRTRANPIFTFIQFGARDASSTDSMVAASANYITRLTFQSDGRGTTIGLTTDINDISAIVDDCVFTDWMSFRSPFVVQFQSVFHIRNTVLRNFNTASEIADVSFEGIVHFTNVSLANVTLEHGAVVSTTLNGYQSAIGYSLTYYAEDDEEYDVPLTPVAPGEASMWGEEFVIVNATMSDCVYLLAPDTTVYPGCPANSTEKRKAVRERAAGGADQSMALFVDSDAAVPFSDVAEYQDGEALYPAGAGANEYQYYDYFGPVGADLYTDYLFKSDPNVWFVEKFLDMDDPWIVATQQVLPPLPPAPGWPAFVLDPPPQPRIRTSLLPDVVDTGQLPLLPSSGAAVETSQQPQPLRQQTHGRSFFVPFLATACVTALALAVIVVLARRDHMRSQALRRSKSSHRSKDKRVRRKISSDASGRAVSSNAPIPLTPMNPDYDYLLPPQLALFAQPPTAASADTEPGGTIVLPPYTVSTCSAADHVSKHVHPPASTTSHSSKPHTEPSYTAGLTRSSWPIQHVMSVQLQAATTCSRSPGDGSDPSLSIQRAATLSVKQRAQGTDAAGVCPGDQQRSEQRLHQQLNLFQRDDLFMGRFEVLGRRQRRRGGQAVVQFLMDVSDRCEYAAKFFLDHDAFHTEAALYAACSHNVRSAAVPQQAARSTPPCIADGVTVAEISNVAGRFLPQVEAVCGEGASGLVDPSGDPLPPCIVMEKGESLHDWSERAEPDLFASLAVLSNISNRLADMHEAGYVHRDLKPANVMWLPRQNRWTIIDFGCVARIGELAPLSFTLTYAAPEVAAAHQQQDTRIESQAALDSWSLGVIAFELLTGAPAFNMLSEGITGVTSRLLGELPLPWEGHLAHDVKRKLGSLQAPVLQLLQREPSLRLGMRQFGAACTDTFAQHTTGTTAEIKY